jgi:mono/diheme cytochrome c family protein
MFHFRDLLRSSLSVFLSLNLAGAVCAAEWFEAFLENHCVRCHGALSAQSQGISEHGP